MKFIRMLIVWLASKVLAKELAALERYRLSIQQADQWLASYPEYVELLKWLKGEGEGTDAQHIGKLRAELTTVRAHLFEMDLQQLLDDARNPRKVRFLPKLLIERLDAFTAGGERRMSEASVEALAQRMQADLRRSDDGNAAAEAAA
jgi:hypothetical protein